MRSASLPLVLALALGSAACAGLLRQYDLAPSGLPRPEAQLRDWLATGHADSAAVRLARGEAAPGDELLRTLFLASAAYYAGDVEASSGWLEQATQLAQERETKSVSRSALSLISNDLILPYEPSRTERLFIPYYAALARLRLNDRQAAAVEARRLSALLERFEADGWKGETELRAALRYFAASVFAEAGEHNDAAVAYRNAAALDPELVESSDTVEACCTENQGAWTESGEVVVFIEQGYVAHRAGEALWVLLAAHELHAFNDADDRGRARLADTIARRIIAGEPPPLPAETGCGGECADSAASAAAGGTGHGSGHSHGGKDDDASKPYLLKIAWPVMRRSAGIAPPLEMLAGDSTITPRAVADVSSSAIADFDDERPLILARTVARAALKAALAKGAEKKAEEKEEGSGKLVGLLANAGGVLLERADTRSWHLLPARLAVARVRLPAGPQPLTVVLGGEHIDLGAVEVPANGLLVTAFRVW